MRDLTSREADRLIAFTHRHPGPCSLQYVRTGLDAAWSPTGPVDGKIAVFVTDANGVLADLTEWERM